MPETALTIDLVGLAARQLLIARQKLGSKKQGTVEIYCSMISNRWRHGARACARESPASI